MEGTAFIAPMRPWSAWETESGEMLRQTEAVSYEPAGLFRDILANTVGEVRMTQADVENKQYLLATGQLDDAHSLPIAEAKAAVSLDLLISLRNKALESYSELMKMSV